MHYGVSVPNFGEGVDARAIAGLARDTEEAGWDGFFIWDHLLAFSPGQVPVVDPWVALSAAALSTSRVRLGPMVTPLPRRRPAKLARETVSLDLLSGGRLVLGIGIGAMPYEWDYLGEEPDMRVRGAMLDEGLEVLTRLWSGETVSFSGRHYRVDEVAFQPTPLQRPRIPIWVAGAWPRRGPLRRAAGFDGSCPLKVDADGELATLEAGELRELRAVVDRHRRDPAAPFDVMLGGTTPEDPGAARAMLEPLAEAGMTWWQEAVDPRQTDLATFRRRVRRGPPGV